ncbi:DUF1330 domain-containing protein [Amorphus orientalis]|uniref:Uncharacterized protein (DUF1330 family) n=1 Tax=Amorphus orientalis TaxID=649198 RepID=A0AAE3VQU2_9HYPH|nr:DUF1330 domain-containing protein [Amorphus orientalis]MDQ0317019.1 uncharacterized protein (DUF1330 family) [Amorphus orientalis]
MAKGYWIGRVTVTDPDAYKTYVEANAEAFKAYGARFLVRGGAYEVPEGEGRERNVVIEFPSYQAAIDCWHSDAYQHARSFRLNAGAADLVVIEGYEGPQPEES